MKPMVMKKPAECCGTPTLLWNREKGYYMCPCGKLRVNELGLPMKRFVSYTSGGKKGGQAKAANRRKQK